MTAAFDALAAEHELVVLEGAGSPAEINLPDLVNNRMLAHADATALVDGLTAYASGRDYLNFAEQRVDVRKSFSAESWQRLKGVRSAVDPSGLLVANHRIPRFYENGLPTP